MKIKFLGEKSWKEGGTKNFRQKESQRVQKYSVEKSWREKNQREIKLERQCQIFPKLGLKWGEIEGYS